MILLSNINCTFYKFVITNEFNVTIAINISCTFIHIIKGDEKTYYFSC